jgi:tRNA pseudouridine55 synthase
MVRVSPIHGVVVVDKPLGPTSHDVVAKLRKRFQTREVGHAGTLDPLASGVLVVGLGEGTKLTPYLTQADKTYAVTVRLGQETATLDAGSPVIAEAKVPEELGLSSVEPGGLLAAAMATELARTEQVPPAVSAIHVDGERAHDRVRRGETVVIPARPACIRALTYVPGTDDPPTARFVLTVSKGYYVRSFARDLAAAMGTLGHVVELRRLASGAFTSDDAFAFDAPTLPVLSLAEAASRCLPTAVLSETGVRDAGFGRGVRPEDLSTFAEGPHAWLSDAGALVAIGQREGDVGRVMRGFSTSSSSL